MVRSRLASFAPSRPKMIPKASKQKPVNIETRDVIRYNTANLVDFRSPVWKFRDTKLGFA